LADERDIASQGFGFGPREELTAIPGRRR